MGEVKQEIQEYWQKIKDLAEQLKSDGCTAVLDFDVECCWEHDTHYVTGLTLDGQPITKADADRKFRLCIQERSKLGVFSPMSWVRWLGVKWFGKGIWRKKKGK